MTIGWHTSGAGLTPADPSAMLWDLAKPVDKQDNIVRKPDPQVVDRLLADNPQLHR